MMVTTLTYTPRQWLGLLLGLGLVTAPHVNHLPPTILAFVAVVWLWRVAIIFRPDVQPGKIVLLLLTMTGLALLFAQHRAVFGRDAGTGLFVVALILKLMELKRERDVYLVVFLAFIVAATQFLYDQTLWMGLYIILVCGLLLTVLMTLNDAEGGLWRQVRAALTILIQALPLTLALFLLFPRLEAPRWMLLKQDRSARTGLSEFMEPGSITNLGMSDELVFRVRFEGKTPPMRERYWRGPVFSHTDGKRWSEAGRLTSVRTPAKVEFFGQPYRYTLMMEPQDKPWVFALDLPGDFPEQLIMKSTYQLYDSRDLADQRQEYHLESYTRYRAAAITRREHMVNLHLPGPPAQKIQDLVKNLSGYTAPPETFANNVLDHFRQKAFYYSLTPPAMDNDPIATFLFETRTGFCSHYAAAFVYLMRTAGIPSRVVTGYQGGVMNPVGKFIEVRQANAHAWTEIWLDGKGWVRYDPTAAIAPERVEQTLDIERQLETGAISYLDMDSEITRQLSWLSRAGQLWGSVDYSWQRWVINYRSASQQQLLSKWGIADLKQMFFWLGGILTLTTLMLSLFLLKRSRPGHLSAEVRHYQRFCEQFARLGFPRRIGEGARDYARRMAGDFPDQSELINRISAQFIRLRYEPKAQEEDLARFEKLVREFKLELEGKH